MLFWCVRHDKRANLFLLPGFARHTTRMKQLFFLLSAVTFAIVAKAQTNINLTCLVTFNGTNGSMPAGDLILAADGNFYGTTQTGGTNATGDGGSAGTFFKMSPDGILTTIYSFGMGSHWPSGHLVQSKDGSFLGATLQGGQLGDGTIYKMSLDGQLTTIFSFGDYNESGGTSTNGFSPAGLYQGLDGNFYGFTYDYGFTGGATIFKLSPSGDFGTLEVFPGRDTEHPLGPFLAARNGDIYGTIGEKLFRLSPNGRFTTIISNNGTNGILRVAGLIRGKDGLLFGVITYGADGGTILKAGSDGKFSTLAEITCSTPDFPRPTGKLIEVSDGNFYGFASSERRICIGIHNIFTLVRIAPNGRLNTLYEFIGARPQSALIQGNNGKIYGTTDTVYPINQGTIFCFTPDNSN
jgi:uncharacterized repeat protein (TIGR03803 family)